VSAVRKALRDGRHRAPLCRCEIALANLEVWILVARNQIESVVKEQIWGLRGIEVELPGRKAFLLPSVPIESGIADEKDLLDRIYRKARIWSTAVRAEAQLYETEWQHLTESPTGPVQLERLRRADWEVTAHLSIFDIAFSAAKHLVGLQQSDGSYLYEHNAMSGARAEGYGSFIRQVGCTYAIARFSRYLERRAPHGSDRSEFRSALTLGMSFIEDHAYERDGQMYIGDDRHEVAALNCASFALLAFSYAGRSVQGISICQRLLKSILNSQSSDGWFPHDMLRPDCRGGQDFAPGQALLGLAMQYTGNLELVGSSVRKAYKSYVMTSVESKSFFFLAWQAKAWCELWRKMGLDEFAEFAFKLLDHLVMRQIPSDDRTTDFRGGYDECGDMVKCRRPPSFLVALFTEAVVIGLSVAAERQDTTRAERYERCARAGLKFLFRLQIEQAQFGLLSEPAVSAGGFRRDLASFDMRCDYTMHALTCLTAALEHGLDHTAA
jgi:hypothetical protein